MSVVRRPDGMWRARYRDASGKEHSKHEARKVDAERWLRQQRGRLDRGEWTDPALGLMTVRDWSKRWIAGRPIKPKTRAGYESLLRSRVLPRWGDVRLSSVTYGEVTAWAGAMTSEGLSASRVRAAVGLLSHMLDDAVKDNRIARNVAKSVDLPRLPERMKRRRLNAAQVQALAAACEDYRLMVLVLAYSGLRIGEVCALRVDNVNPFRKRLEVEQSLAEVNGKLIFGPTKNHQRRPVPLPDFVLEELVLTLAGREPDELLFTSPEGAPVRYPNFRRRVWDPARAQVGLDWLTPHGLRHFAISLAIARGAKPTDIARMVGHRDATLIFSTYADLFDDDLDAVSQRMNADGARARADYLRTKAASGPLRSVK